MKEVSELQNRRAVNWIWNAARDYGFQPDFKAYDAEGKAELYLNCIIGALRRHYEYPKIASLFAAFSQYGEDSDIYEGLLWLGLENCVYQKELPERPILRRLREDYARRYVESFGGSVPDDYRLLDCLSYAHYLRVLGKAPRLSRYDICLLDELEFSPELTTDELVEKARALFSRWFQITAEERRAERGAFRLSLVRRKAKQLRGRYRKLGPGFLDHPRVNGSVLEPEGEKSRVKTTLSTEQLRAFMSGKYGRSLYPPQELEAVERQLCTGNHRSCHLHFTKGAPAEGVIQNAFEALQKQREAAQAEKNRRYYEARQAQARAAALRLSAAIQNSVLLHLRPASVRSNAGLLEGGRVWRAALLDDERVFTCREQDDMGELCVDILLDASTSQQHRQEIVSSQGYLIAEALTHCDLPCRVMSFCSMAGFTILRVFRDYNEPQNNRRIFEYVSNGCNRDGLAIRAAHHLIADAPYEHKLLIVLSDVKPNDVVPIPGTGGREYLDYEKDAGIRDTACEVRRARADGIAVVCVFTGEDGELPAARLVYGRDFARIQSFDRLAETVGKLIRNQLRNL